MSAKLKGVALLPFLRGNETMNSFLLLWKRAPNPFSRENLINCFFSTYFLMADTIKLEAYFWSNAHILKAGYFLQFITLLPDDLKVHLPNSKKHGFFFKEQFRFFHLKQFLHWNCARIWPFAKLDVLESVGLHMAQKKTFRLIKLSTLNE